MLKGVPATNVFGAGTTYTFSFESSAPGIIGSSWNATHHITDLAGNRFAETDSGATWQYTVVDTVAPTLAAVNPLPGSTVSRLMQVVVAFSEPVVGVDAFDLLVNGVPADSLAGSGAGPYTFGFAIPSPGVVIFSWAINPGIGDTAPVANNFRGGNWSYTLKPGEFSGDIVINEFLASNANTNGLRDEDGNLEDWIELYNRGAGAVNLGGWSLTDDASNPELWTFPPVTLESGHYLLVFASGKDRKPTGGENLHSNFKLGTHASYLGLFNADFPRQVATEFLPAYPRQRADVSYGLFGDGFRYSTNPTPGNANSGPAVFNGFASEPVASVKSGFFNRSFALTLSTPTPGASIRYTLNGREPTLANGFLYNGPIMVAGTPTQAVINVRAVAFASGLLCSKVSTYSYIFPDYVLLQPSNPPTAPSSWSTATNAFSPLPTVVTADYEMDPQVITNTAYTSLARQALTSTPTLSLVMDPDDLFSQQRGIYANPNPVQSERNAWQRTVSAELVLPDGGSGFRLDGGVRVQGGTSRQPNRTRKHSLRLFFDSSYAGKLDYPFFADSPVQSYKTLVLDGASNLSWHNPYDFLPERAQYVRDQFCSDMQRALGHPAPHGRFVHLYLNGLYWGLYNVHERPDEDFAANYLGGEPDQYDVVRNSDGALEVVHGDATAWNAMLALVNPGLANSSQYEQIQQYLDIPAFIDYLIVNFYAGNTDWSMHNWYACRKRTPGAGYQFQSWDAEITLKSVNENTTGLNQPGTPTGIHAFLKNNPEYRLKFSDRLQKFCFTGGALFVDTNNPAVDPAHPERNRPAALYMKRIAEIDPAIVLESARWGDSASGHEDAPYTRNVEWLNELNWLRDTYFPQRVPVVLDQLKTCLLYPGAYGVQPPSFAQHGGNVPRGFNLAMSAPAGTIYYTTNGADPRVYGAGAVSPDARAYSAPEIINRTAEIKARVLNSGNWSPLTEAYFSVAQIPTPLRITEIMYAPSGGDAYEFIELQNGGGTPLDLGGYSFQGVTYIFPSGTILAPEAVLVLCSAQGTNMFSARYPGVSVAGAFTGKLSNNGEHLAVLDAAGRTVISVDYSDQPPWPAARNGSSLEIIDPLGDPDDAANWRASAVTNGTPATISSPPAPGPVLINEVLARNAGVVTNGSSFPNYLELVNNGASAVNLGGWSVTDSSASHRFIFPDGTAIASGGFLVLYCDDLMTEPGLHTGFALNDHGETISLFDATSNRADAVTYGLQLPDLSVGRIAGIWQLSFPTPNAANQSASTASASNLVLNEWMANACPAQQDWIELFNPASLPIPLRGLHLQTSNALFQIASLSFVASHGYLRLFADENPGPDHLDFKLPATGGVIILDDAAGTEIDRVAYGPQMECVSQGRLPDGSSTIVSFPGSATPGTTNAVVSYAGPRLNEIMARNATAVVTPFGQHADWIELFNPGDTAFDLTGMSLSLDKLEAGQWLFPPGTTISPADYLVIWCDSTLDPTTNAASVLNTGRALNGESGGVYLFNPSGQVIDYVEYGFQIADQSIGRSAGEWRLLANPTPGAANAEAAALGAPVNLRFNEWMAGPLGGDDWLELYNLDPQPVVLGGLYLSDDPSLLGLTKFKVAPLSFISGHGWVKWVADASAGKGRDHLNFKLDQSGESLRLYNADFRLIDSVDMEAQQWGVSQGRLPDGGSSITSFVSTPTPGAGNYLPLTNAAINEVLTHATWPCEQAVELVNLSGTPLNVSGWYLSDSQSEPKKFRIPNLPSLPAEGFAVFYESQFNPKPGFFPSFCADGAHGGELLLSEAGAAGNLTGRRTLVLFGAAENGVSFGRFPTSAGVAFGALDQVSFGVDSPADAAQFRTGTGRTNSSPRVGPVVINEVMYHPITPTGTNLLENEDLEFIELFNLSSSVVPLFDPLAPTNTWRLRDGITFSFPTNLFVPPQGYLLVVKFDTTANPLALATFRASYAVDPGVPVIGPYRGKLNNSGETIFLEKPLTPLATGPDRGFIPYVTVDCLDYSLSAPWPSAPAAGGGSLQRRLPSAYGNDPLNWKGASPTAGRTNAASGSVPPVIMSQPQSQVVVAGGTATFAVVAEGTPPVNFAWQINGVALPGAIHAALTLTNVQPSDSGAYQVQLANAVGSVLSQPATLTVLTPPVVTRQPENQAVTVGADVLFSVSLDGTPPFGFQWYRNNCLIPGATNISLALSHVGLEDSGTYVLVATNYAGPVVSKPATLVMSGVDTDGDGLPDSWEIQHGLDPLNPNDAALDSDGDGLSNLQEFVAGTDPRDPRSNLTLRLANSASGIRGIHFEFTALPGVGYMVQFRESLTARWQDLLEVSPQPITRMVPVAPGLEGGAGRGFYRVVVPNRGLAPMDINAPGLDSDGDGFSDLQETLAGTDPRDPHNYLKLQTARAESGTNGVQFEFTAAAGVSYTVQFRDSLTAPWRKLADFPAELATRKGRVTPAVQGGAAHQFYRVVVPMQP